MAKVYINTAIPYVNGVPHIGHALDYCLADVCARYHRLMGDEVRVSAGTDEHGNKIQQKANELGVPVKQYVDENAAKFKDFISKLGVEYTDYVRTTDSDHERLAQEIWKKLSSHIYKATYDGWYCPGCERYVTKKEYDENHGICPDHNKPYEEFEEENYYFRISDFKDQIKAAIESKELLILPDYRAKEMLALLEESPDVSFSRPTSQLSWGVPIPGDDSQVMYVWMDALANYLTVLGYPEKEISDWWPATAEFVGKDILRFHSIIWPAMLMGLGLPLPKALVSHGMVLADGQKMSKSIGNVVDPLDVINRYGIDGFRYYFLRHIDTFSDSNFTWEKFENAYNNELANDLGNLVQRLSSMFSKHNIKFLKHNVKFSEQYIELMNNYEYSKAMDYVWEKIQNLNRKVDEEKPWMLAKAGEMEKLENCLNELGNGVVEVAYELLPFLPGSAEKILAVFGADVTPPSEPLFPKNRE